MQHDYRTIGKIPVDWEQSIICPVFKGKGDPLSCSSYRGIKLLEHGLENILMCLGYFIGDFGFLVI